MEEIKEVFIKDSLEPISMKTTELILEQMKNCVCKIHIGETKATGFFIKIPFNNNLISVLITNNHALNNEHIGKNISISLNNDKIFKSIILDSKRKIYTNNI